MSQPLTDAEKFRLQIVLRDNLEIDEIKYIVLEIGISLGNLDVFSRDELVKKLIHFAELRGEVDKVLYLAKQLKPNVDFFSYQEKQQKTDADFSTEQEAMSLSKKDLYQVLVSRFNLDELKQLCFELDISDESFSGSTREQFAREFILYMERRDRLDELREQLKKLEDEQRQAPNTAEKPSQDTSAKSKPEDDKPKKPLKVFYSYSHKDEQYKDDLITHLAIMRRQGLIEEWNDRCISLGDEWENAIDENLENADIILLLISADFIASDYCYNKEMKFAMKRHEAGEAKVIPLMMRPCQFQKSPFAKLQGAPKNMLPVSKWKDRDEAFYDIAEKLEKLIANWK